MELTKQDSAKIEQKTQEMRNRMYQIHNEIASTEIIGESEEGLVKITMNGVHKALGIDISDSLIIMEGKEKLQQSILVAINDAASKFEEISKEKVLVFTKEGI